MKRFCENCDEELVGAVNRCWRCGTTVQVELLADIPPIRRAPVDLNEAAPPPAPTNAPAAVITPPGRLERLLTPQLNEVQQRRCGNASVACGALACFTGLFNGWAILLAVVALALGVLGMGARRRDLATMGLVLAVLGMFLGFWQVGFDYWAKYQSQQLLNEWQGGP